MKDKLRELAEMVREAYRAGFIAACKWPEPVSQDVDSSAYNKEFNDWSFSVREKHAAILDAEGDDGAVPYGHEFYDASGIYHFIRGTLPGYAQTKIVPLYTHPARSGVVSDEWVGEIECCDAKGFWQIGRAHV